jgi:hypothetical protein
MQVYSQGVQQNWFAILGFFYDFLWFFQASGPNQKETKNLLSTQTLERFKSSQNNPWSSQPYPDGGGELANDSAGPEGANK